MIRATLPNRRPNRTIRVGWSGHNFHVTVGLDAQTGQPTEMFFSDGMKSGADLLHTVQDACILVSREMQRGIPVGEIGKSMSATGIIGALVAAVVKDMARDAPVWEGSA